MAERLTRAGFLAAEHEAGLLIARAGDDPDLLESMVGRRLTGEPLAWIVGHVSFGGSTYQVDPGVYVPRSQSEALAQRAVDRLGEHGVAVDLCTGTGIIAATLHAAHPRALVVASDIDERAVACAAANGVDAYQGDVFTPLEPVLDTPVDVVVAVVPYVPTPDLRVLARDTFTFESPRSYDGGPDGTDVLRRVLHDSLRFLRIGGTMLLELGGQQAAFLEDELHRLGYRELSILTDADGDVRGIEATLVRRPVGGR